MLKIDQVISIINGNNQLIPVDPSNLICDVRVIVSRTEKLMNVSRMALFSILQSVGW